MYQHCHDRFAATFKLNKQSLTDILSPTPLFSWLTQINHPPESARTRNRTCAESSTARVNCFSVLAIKTEEVCYCGWFACIATHAQFIFLYTHKYSVIRNYWDMKTHNCRLSAQSWSRAFSRVMRQCDRWETCKKEHLTLDKLFL